MGNTHDTEIARIEADYIHTKWRTTDDYRWGYSSDRGPETWWLHFPSASGGQQSPIDIVAEEVTFDPELCHHPLTIYYPPPRPEPINHSGKSNFDDDDDDDDDAGRYGADFGDSGATAGGRSGMESASSGPKREKMMVINTGNAVRIDLSHSDSRVTGGPCREYTYTLECIYIHWGEDDSCGSEHLIDSHSYSAEVHLIHWNEDLYDSYEEAAKREDGIVILGVLVKVSDDSRPNKVLSMVADRLEDIHYRCQSTSLPRHISADLLLPEDTSRYWTYRGSFTVPPCYETVTWVLFHDPITISSRHLAKYRELRSYGETEHGDGSDDFIVRNCRPQQPIGTRKVYTVENNGQDMFVDGMPVGLHSSNAGRSPYSASDERPFRQTSKFARPSSFFDGGGSGSGGPSGMRQPSRRA